MSGRRYGRRPPRRRSGMFLTDMGRGNWPRVVALLLVLALGGFTAFAVIWDLIAN